MLGIISIHNQLVSNIGWTGVGNLWLVNFYGTIWLDIPPHCYGRTKNPSGRWLVLVRRSSAVALWSLFSGAVFEIWVLERVSISFYSTTINVAFIR